MSLRVESLMANAALCIWLAQSRLWRKFFRSFSDKPSAGTHGTGSHHFSSFRWTTTFRNDPESLPPLLEFIDELPLSTYQNSFSVKPSNISYKNSKSNSESWFINVSYFQYSTYHEHIIEFSQSRKIHENIRS